jgi:hypothetical protein
MVTPSNQSARRGGRGLRPWLLIVKVIGLIFFIGGLASMAVLGVLGPRPETLEGWRTLRAVVHTGVLRCVLPGALLAIACGVALFLRHPGMFLRLRWFRLKAVLLIVATPGLHFWSRGRVRGLDEALAAGRLDEVSQRWREVATSFVVAVVIYLAIVAIGRFKPRLGERPGSRARS